MWEWTLGVIDSVGITGALLAAIGQLDGWRARCSTDFANGPARDLSGNLASPASVA
ncbi:MAG: hypothetical protein ACTMIR_15335 [Cellulomonadaceae bacterium]